MLKNIIIFLIGLAVGAIYPNEAKSIVNSALAYIQNSIHNMQSNLNVPNTPQQYPVTPQQKIDYEKLKKQNQDIVKNLDEDWK